MEGRKGRQRQSRWRVKNDHCMGGKSPRLWRDVWFFFSIQKGYWSREIQRGLKRFKRIRKFNWNKMKYRISAAVSNVMSTVSFVSSLPVVLLSSKEDKAAFTRASLCLWASPLRASVGLTLVGSSQAWQHPDTAKWFMSRSESGEQMTTQIWPLMSYQPLIMKQTTLRPAVV